MRVMKQVVIVFLGSLAVRQTKNSVLHPVTCAMGRVTVLMDQTKEIAVSDKYNELGYFASSKLFFLEIQ